MITKADRSFLEAATRLSKVNLTTLWSFSSAISSLDYLPRVFEGSVFGPLGVVAHPHKLAMFGRAVLTSKSADYKDRHLSVRDAVFVLNKLNDAMHDEAWFPVQSGEPNAHTLLRILVAIASRQFPLQEAKLASRLSRAYLLNELIPSEEEDYLRTQCGREFLDIPRVYEAATGATVRQTLGIGFRVLALHHRRFGPLLRAIESRQSGVSMAERRRDGSRRHAKLLRTIAASIGELAGLTKFGISDVLLSDEPQVISDKVSALFGTISGTTSELRALLDVPPYNTGLLPYRLSPLERYPLVRLAQGGPTNGPYIVPSLAFLDRLITDLPHFVLQEGAETRNRYWTTRGRVQEIYLERLVAARLPDLIVVPEKRYRAPGGEASGPDLTLLDSKRQRLIAVESKSKRIRAATRADPSDSPFVQDMAAACDALRRLPLKIRQMTEGIEEYQHLRDDFARCLQHTPVLVVVVGEGGELLAERFEAVKAADSSILPVEEDLPYCIMDLELFEHAVELAASSGDGLANVLEAYAAAARGLLREGPDGVTAASLFGGREFDTRETYLASYWDSVLTEGGLG